MDLYQQPLAGGVAEDNVIARGTSFGGGVDHDELVNEPGRDKIDEPFIEEDARNKKPEFEYEHVIGCIGLPKNCPHTDEPLALLLAVSNLELVIGCHSFEKYLSPKFETIFILNEQEASGKDLESG
jgi:hypothetical protein